MSREHILSASARTHVKLCALFLCLFPMVAHSDEAAPQASDALTRKLLDFERGHARTTRRKLGLMYAVVASGAASTAVGIGLLFDRSHDEAYRVAGGLTLGFGAINLLLGAAAIPGLLYGERAFEKGHATRATPLGYATAERDEARAERRQTILFAVNAGLDGGYILGGLAAVLASRLGVDHPDRWLGGGIAMAVQGVLALAVDVTATTIASGRQAELLQSWTPTLVLTKTPEGTRASAGFTGRF
jgi:hypothetical protein